MMNKSFNFLAIFLLVVFLFSCDDKYSAKDSTVETMNSGKISVSVDASIYNVLDTAFKLYNLVYPNVKIDLQVVESRKAMSLLLSGNSRAIIIARDYLKDEDSLMKIYKVEKHKKIEVAQDALVLFANPDFPLDTLTDEQLRSILTKKDVKFTDYFKNLASEPQIVTNTVNSSEWANLNSLVTKGNKISKPIVQLSTIDSIKNFVVNNKNSIGISYLSQLAKDQNFKILRISFVNEKGKYEPPQIVHQAFVVQKRYPYIFSYWAYLLEDRMNLPYWFASFVGKEAKIQQYFKEIGIVPAFAKIIIIKED